MIAASGRDPSQMPTRDQVHKKFGAPVESGEIDGESYDDFRTHLKIADPVEAWMRWQCFVPSLVLYDFINIPMARSHAVRDVVLGRDVGFRYDSFGNVTYYRHCGAWLLRPRPTPPAAEPPANVDLASGR
jgi:hypothetical protein